MPVIGITGGIASGKSTVSRQLVQGLRERLNKDVLSFSADESAHQLLQHNPVVQAEICSDFGTGVFDANGKIDRGHLRKMIFADAEKRKALESILHPKIREAWVTESQEFRLGEQYFVAEIPLLYETKASDYFDCIVVVEADVRVQLERLSSKRGWSLETARRVIDAQMPAEDKIRRADILILNNHTEKLLFSQIQLATGALLMRYA